ncbi:hypothetical protein [Noviherbaspirillum soli]|uniref:hypothetical protein n=1 Tax=Noviherbaspirillum soli TaxID=1064518 RepID=UPI00188BA564|nr:hypothetical protein [Noviherbaspirillum soli]
MHNHVSLMASSHASERRGQLIRLMEMGRRTAGFDLDRSVRAREVKHKGADGSEMTGTVLFIRTGKESVLESIENWFFSRQDQKLGRQLFEQAFPEWKDTSKKTFLNSLFEKDRITVRTLDDKVDPRKKASAAFRISWQQAAEAFRTVLDRHPGKGYLPGQWRLAGSQIVYIRSCLGLPARWSKDDEMFGKFMAFAAGLQSDDFRLATLDTRQRLVEQARQFCTAWSRQKARKPERHKHTVRTGNLGFLDELVIQFQKSFAA